MGATKEETPETLTIPAAALAAYVSAKAGLESARKKIKDHEATLEETRKQLPAALLAALESASANGDEEDSTPTKTIRVDDAGKAAISKAILEVLRPAGKDGMAWGDVETKVREIVKFDCSDSHLTGERKKLADNEKIKKEGDTTKAKWHVVKQSSAK